MKKKNDIKFIIYQSLYIFVICVIAIKGADINLDEVEIKHLLDLKFAYIDTTQNRIVPITSKLIEFDSNIYQIVLKTDIINSPGKYQPQITGVTPPPIINNNPPPNESGNVTPPTVSNNPNPTDPILPGKIPFVQYRINSLTNNYDMPLEIEGVKTIPAKSTVSFEIDGQSTVTVKIGNSTKTYPVAPNEKPKISFQRIASMGENAKVTELQRTICYRVTISDDYPDQLDVKITGPVTFKQVSPTVYDITMNAFGSKQAFDNYIDNRQQPYQMGFNVNVTDKIAKHNVTAQNNFVFGEW